MRTTLEIDDDMLAIARVQARERGTSLGTAVSQLMRQGLRGSRRDLASGFPVFEAPSDAPVVTDELVVRYRDDDPR